MTLGYLKEQKEKYQKKAEYFEAMDFTNLANDFKSIINLICEMENFIKEKSDGENNKD
jgi:hypothetical protein